MFHFLMKYKQQGWFLVVGWSMYFFPTLETRISERKVSMGWSSTHLLSCIECVLVVGLSIRFLCYTPFFFFLQHSLLYSLSSNKHTMVMDN